MGKDPATNTLPQDGSQQVVHAFANAKTLLGIAEVSSDDVVYVDVLLGENNLRDQVNKSWIEWFPDPSNRPARHITVRDLPSGMLVQLRIQADVGAT